jgi:hypothetical protein
MRTDKGHITLACRSGLAACALALVFGAVACNGEIAGPGKPPGMPTSPGKMEPPLDPMTGMPVNADVGRQAIHRLNNSEYDNTVRDLLGLPAAARTSFIPDEKSVGFDNIASAFGMTAAQYEQYFNSALALSDKVFADAALRSKIVTCAPAAAGDVNCTKAIVKAFGQRAYRRPLQPAEIDGLTKLGTDALALGEDFNGAIKQVVKTVLASVPFLYRVEMDSDPNSKAAHPLDAYELASRLSYLQWSTMPDDQLFMAASDGSLMKTDVLSAQVDRMLADPKAKEFTASFAGQWLGLRTFQGHQVDTTVFPMFDEATRQAMYQEGILYFSEFLAGSLTMDKFFSTDMNFVNAKLGAFYGITGGGATDLTKVTNTGDERVGFLGLGAFLTQTSYSYRTAPTLRGVWVLENLLCQEIPPPPANVPDLDGPAAPVTMTQSQNVRMRLAAHRQNPACSACHTTLDPIGLGLENFDAVGRFRQTYPNGDAIDASGVMPDGATFNGLPSLAALLGRNADTRLIDCAAKKLMTYGLSREITDADGPYVNQVRDNWKKQGLGMRNLLKTIILNDTFRFRRGEPPV